MKKLTLVLMAVVLGVLLTVPAFAFGPVSVPGNGPRRRPRILSGMQYLKS